jgi:hypothetical protein
VVRVVPAAQSPVVLRTAGPATLKGWLSAECRIGERAPCLQETTRRLCNAISMMNLVISFENSIVIDLLVDEVYDFVSDLTSITKWN